MFDSVMRLARLQLACWRARLRAHQPHDPMTAAAVSPNYAQDQTVLAATGSLSG